MEEPLRSYIWRLLQPGEATSRTHVVVSGVLVASILGTVAIRLVATMKGLDPGLRAALDAVADGISILFTVEYVIRLVLAPEGDPDPILAPWRARYGYLISPLGVADLLAAAPFWLAATGMMPVDVAAVVSMVALVKLARYVSALRLLAHVMRNESRPLLSAMLTLVVLLVLASGAMYLLEHEAQPDQFSSIPHTLWWGIVTIATVGYGDMTPVTMGGKVFGGMIMLLGVAMFAVPAGILATGFAAEIRRRDFLVTWQTVAQVPLFAGLDASRIAEITRLLKPQIVPARHVVVRHGDPADSMFFIMSGEVEVELQPRPVTLKKGAYFGEIALLKETMRTATVTTLTDCHLLALDVGDFKRLMTTYPAIEENVMKLADNRLKELDPGGSAGNGAG